MYGFCVCGGRGGGDAYLASRVRAMMPAATEEEREVSDLARLQLCRGPSVACRGHQSCSALIINSVHLQDWALLCWVASVELATQDFHTVL